MKNKGTILFLMCSLFGMLLGFFFLAVGLKMDVGSDGALQICQTLYIILGSFFAFICTSIAALTMVKLAKEEEDNKPK